MPLNWYAVYTRHQHEKSASQVLANKGFETLLPLYRVPHRWKDRTQIVQLPVFSCYVFVKAAMERKLEILRTPGVCWIVGNGGYAIPLAQHDLDLVRTASSSSLRLEPHPFLKSGDRVRVRSGPLTGFEGFLTRVKNQYRVVLSIELLKQAAAVEVDLSMIEPTTGSQKSLRPFMSESNCND